MCFSGSKVRARFLKNMRLCTRYSFKEINQTKMKVFSFAMLLGLFIATNAAPTLTKIEKEESVIAIDLGTTNSRVGMYKDGRVHIIADDQGKTNIPSCVAFTNSDDHLIGDTAKNQQITNPESTVFNVKSLIGREWNDEYVQHDVQFFPFKVIKENNKPHIQVNTIHGVKTFDPKEISAIVLGKMKKIAEAYLNKTVHYAVITVPAHFNNAQRQATIDAGKIAGLNVIRIINEATAAAVAYGLNEKEKTVLVYKLGGGTFDVSLIYIEDGLFEVQATNGDTHLGGEDFNRRIMDYFINLYKTNKGKDIRKDSKAIQKLHHEIEKAKIILSEKEEVKIEIQNFFEGKTFLETLTRLKFEELNMDLFQRTLTSMGKLLKDFSSSIQEVDEIILVGGSTRIPKVQQLIKQYFEDKKLRKIDNSDEAVVYGAAVQAEMLTERRTVHQIYILDLNPLGVGIATSDGFMIPIIPKNSVIPTKRTSVFPTVHDNQQAALVQVYQGNNHTANNNYYINEFLINNIQSELTEKPKIEVTIEIDDNGLICNVQANLFKKPLRSHRKGMILLLKNP